jgi:hypothetical protein
MKTHAKRFLAGVMGLLLLLFPIAPASAMHLPPIDGVHTYVEHVHYDWHDRPGWYHGHRGYRNWRHEYRRHADGWWYPMSAFTAGAIIGSAIASQSYARPTVDTLPAEHVDWCYARYRTYRVSDNTYAPRVGMRASCHSPYY